MGEAVVTNSLPHAMSSIGMFRDGPMGLAVEFAGAFVGTPHASAIFRILESDLARCD
ncbi:MAG: hypothetical protein J6D54_11395 [Olsenella sp.]|nr:hypothetical protein [Olsenella sp.]